MPSTTNPKDEEIVDAPGNDGNASMPEQVKRPNPWRKMMMMMMMTMCIFVVVVLFVLSFFKYCTF
jgi:heme/copper-type cytochrome/quinol oxidase subunit 2